MVKIVFTVLYCFSNKRLTIELYYRNEAHTICKIYQFENVLQKNVQTKVFEQVLKWFRFGKIVSKDKVKIIFKYIDNRVFHIIVDQQNDLYDQLYNELKYFRDGYLDYFQVVEMEEK